MELINFRVSMYKGILDSGWVNVNNLTVLVGKNESGKTSLLKALHKLNPYVEEPYDIRNEWPRGYRGKQDEEHVVCHATFKLSDQEKSELRQLSDTEKLPDIVQASRNYAGQLAINFVKVSYTETGQLQYEEDFFSNVSSPVEIDTIPVEIDTILRDLPKVSPYCSEAFKKCANECLGQVKNLANEKQFADLKPLVKKHEVLLRQKRVEEHKDSYSIEGQFINRYLSYLNQLAERIQQVPTPLSKAHKFITENLPTFIYMNEYRTFSGNAHLKDVQSRKNDGRLTEADKTFLMILHLSNLDLDKLVQIGQKNNQEESRERLRDVRDGAVHLTKKLSNRLLKGNYVVEFEIDDSFFFTTIKDDADSVPTELEERSKGFQWDFSFELMLKHETNGTFKGCVILLDEPALHLHPGAQEGLLSRLKEFAQENTLLYTTHLPFMIDLSHPEQIRVLEKAEEGITVTDDLVNNFSEARGTLQAALEMDASHGLLATKRNLVVEGVHDFLILTELSNLLERSGKGGLPVDIRITPGSGASKSVTVATYMIGQDLDVIALFDSDQEGRAAEQELREKWITAYKKSHTGTSHTGTMLLGDVVNANDDFELEDLFSENFMKEIVKETYVRELADAGVDEITLGEDGMIWNRIESFMGKHNIDKINKGSIAKRLRNRLNKMEDIGELPKETQEKVINLFEAIRSAFGEENTGAS